jgi:hypothetical protein
MKRHCIELQLFSLSWQPKGMRETCKHWTKNVFKFLYNVCPKREHLLKCCIVVTLSSSRYGKASTRKFIIVDRKSINNWFSDTNRLLCVSDLEMFCVLLVRFMRWFCLLIRVCLLLELTFPFEAHGVF